MSGIFDALEGEGFVPSPPNPSERLRGVIEQAKIWLEKEGTLRDQVELVRNRIQQMTVARNRNSEEAYRFESVIDEVNREIGFGQLDFVVSGDRHAQDLQLARLNGKLDALTPFYEPPMNIVKDLNAKIKADYKVLEGLRNDLRVVQEEKKGVLILINNGFHNVLVYNVDDVIFLSKYCELTYSFSVPSTEDFLASLSAAFADNGVRVTYEKTNVAAA